MNRYWFTRKMIGIGATPATWEGWLVSLVYCALVIVLANTMVVRGSHSGLMIGGFVVAMLVLTGAFIALIAVKIKGGLGAMLGGPDS